MFAEIAHRIYLILHKRDQWRNDNCRAFAHQRRQLVTERFTASGGHDHKGVAAGKEAFDNSLLIAFEFVESKVHFQCLRQCERFCGHVLILIFQIVVAICSVIPRLRRNARL